MICWIIWIKKICVSYTLEETKSDFDDEDSLIYFVIFDEFDNFAILGCINQNYKRNSKEDMTENLSKSQVESEDDVVKEIRRLAENVQRKKRL